MSADAPIWLNGSLVRSGGAARISVFDRGFTLSDGLFETIRAEGASPLWLADHLARLRTGAGLLGIPVPLADDAIAAGLSGLLAAGGHERSALRLTLTRGPAARRGLWPAGEPVSPTLAATVAPLGSGHGPLRVIVARGTRRNEHSPLSGIKSLNYGDNLLARREAEARGADDALMRNGAGRLVCGTVGNLFARIEGRWRTPPPIEGALPGLARRRLIALLPAEEAPIARSDLAAIDWAFLSNCLALSPIGKIDEHDLAHRDMPGETRGLFGPDEQVY